MSSHDLTDLLADEIISYILEFLDGVDVIHFASLSKRLHAIAREAELCVFSASLYSSITRRNTFRSDCRAFSKRMELLNRARLLVNVSISIDSYVYPAPNESDSEPDSDHQNASTSLSSGVVGAGLPRNTHPWTRAATAVRESITSGNIVNFELSLPVIEYRDIEPALSLPAPRLRSLIIRPDDQDGPISLSRDLFAGHASRLRSVVVGPLVHLPQPRPIHNIFSGVTSVNLTLGPLLEGLEVISVQFPAARYLALTPDIIRGGVSSALHYNAASQVKANQLVDKLPQPLHHLSLRLESRESFAGQHNLLAQKLYVAIRARHTAASNTVLPTRLLLRKASYLPTHCTPTFASYFFEPDISEPLAATLEPPIYSRYAPADCNLVLCLHRDSGLQYRMEIVLGDLSWVPEWGIGGSMKEATPTIFERIISLTITADWLEKEALRKWLQLPNIKTVRVVLARGYERPLPDVDGDASRVATGEVLQIVLVTPHGPHRSVPPAYAESIVNRLGSLTVRPTRLELENGSIEVAL